MAETTPSLNVYIRFSQYFVRRLDSRHTQHRSTPHRMNFDRHGGLLAKVGFAALTCNSALAIYRSRGDPSSVAFVAGAYGAIALLFYFLRKFERGEGNRGKTKAAVWLLTTLLTAMFASRVAPLMPPAVGSLVYLMATATTGAGFWALILNT